MILTHRNLTLASILFFSACNSDDTQEMLDIQDSFSLIAFTSEVDGIPQIFTMIPDGSQIVQLTDDDGIKAHPDWSSDGLQIAYTVEYNIGSPEAYSDIYIIDIDGSDQLLIANTRDAHHPRWSPDDSKIVFEQTVDNNSDIYIINIDGSEKTRLTTDPANDNTPDWSPDGNQISFQSERNASQPFEAGLYIMNQDGSDQHLIFFTRELFCSAWAPDGSGIIFGALQPVPESSLEYVDLFTINSDGSDLTRITTSPEQEVYPSISPDGNSVVYMSDFRLFVMNIDGTNSHRIEARDMVDEDPAWSPALMEEDLDRGGVNN